MVEVRYINNSVCYLTCIQAYGALAALTSPKSDLDNLFGQLGEKYGLSKGAIILLWLKSHKIVAVTTTSKDERFEEYNKVYASTLEEVDREAISKIGEQYLDVKFPEHLSNVVV